MRNNIQGEIHPSTKSLSDFNEIWYVDRGRWLMHDGMPYDPIQGQGQGHSCLKATQTESTVNPARDEFLFSLQLLLVGLKISNMHKNNWGDKSGWNSYHMAGMKPCQLKLFCNIVTSKSENFHRCFLKNSWRSLQNYQDWRGWMYVGIFLQLGLSLRFEHGGVNFCKYLEKPVSHAS